MFDILDSAETTGRLTKEKRDPLARKNNPSRMTPRIGIPGTNRYVNPIVSLAAGAALTVFGGARAIGPAENIIRGSSGSESVPSGVKIEPASRDYGLTWEKMRMTDREIEKAINAAPVNLKENARSVIPLIVKAFEDEGITSKKVLAFAFATAEYEAHFDVAKSEFEGEIQAKKLDYEGGMYGRGLSMLTHERNYREIGDYLKRKYPAYHDLDLVKTPDRAFEPDLSAKILAAFFKINGIVGLIENGDLERARRMFVGDYDSGDEYNKKITRYIISRTLEYLAVMTAK